MKQRTRAANPIAPKPVHPSAVRHHGLFGTSYVRQHMMVDKHWTMNSLTEEFKGMSDLLASRVIFKKLEGQANRTNFLNENRDLKRQCRDGRAKLQMSLYGNNTKAIRNNLINHRDMQRLYQKMPVHLVVDNINQRTFVMRKERDRLRFRLDQLKRKYETALLARAELENRFRYRDVFVLEEDKKSREFMKRIENSNVRLNAIKTINSTYKKMIQVLQQDSIFYEPILRSLNKDIEDQGNFIKHILYIGMPAISRFKDLSEEYRLLEEKSRKTLQTKLQWVANFKKSQQKRMSVSNKVVAGPVDVDPLKRYVRETHSMLMLRNMLEAIESTIKQVKFVTLCSRAKEIYPRIRTQVENNEKLKKMTENEGLGHQNLESRMKRADVLASVLVNNLTFEEVGRKGRMKELEEAIAKEDAFEAATLAHIKNRADTYVLLRFTLWNVSDIMRNVDRPSTVSYNAYPNSYLNLPLLKFEMLTVHAWPPGAFEENVDNIMHTCKRKLYLLMKTFNKFDHKNTIAHNRREYHKIFLDQHDLLDEAAEVGDVHAPQPAEEAEEVIQDSKPVHNVPTRKQIKAQSAKLVEELSKKED